jgi:hypothetical protein
MIEQWKTTASLRRAYLRLAASSVRLGFLNARHTDAPIKSDPKWLSVKKAIRAHHLDATRERRIGIMAALENPLKRSY